MIYGSYFGGISLVELDPKDPSKLLHPGTHGTTVASRTTDTVFGSTVPEIITFLRLLSRLILHDFGLDQLIQDQGIERAPDQLLRAFEDPHAFPDELAARQEAMPPVRGRSRKHIADPGGKAARRTATSARAWCR